MGSHPLTRLVARAALVMSLVAAPSLAWAGDESAAETFFQEGLAAMKRNDYPVACEAFAQSNKADPSPGTQINLAVCFEKQKKWASAWTWYRSAVGLAQQRGQAEREKLAEESAARLKPQLHHIVISVKEPLTDLVVKRDGAEVTIALAGKEVPLPVDPGDHTLEVAARGKKPWTKVLQVADNKATDRIEVPTLENAPVEDRGAAAAPGAEYRPPVIISNDGSGQRTVGIVVGGAGLLSALAAAGVFILAKNEESDRDTQRKNANGASNDAQKDAFNRSADDHDKAAKNNQLIAIILGSGAAVLVGVGAVLYFTAPKGSERTANNKTRVLPLLGPSFAGVGLGGTF
jgi:tetratricopeptide (TPR) repeat protein